MNNSQGIGVQEVARMDCWGLAGVDVLHVCKAGHDVGTRGQAGPGAIMQMCRRLSPELGLDLIL